MKKYFAISSLLAIVTLLCLLISWKQKKELNYGGSQVNVTTESELVKKLSKSVYFDSLQESKNRIIRQFHIDYAAQKELRKKYTKRDSALTKNDNQLSDKEKQDSLLKMGFGMSAEFKSLCQKRASFLTAIATEFPELSLLGREAQIRIWAKAKKFYLTENKLSY